ncbi:bifunctional P-loop containing nucleoside triphosphate hydrolase/CWF11 family/DNA2-NAM7 helicase-like [Babesia duncani]|uniref:Bifunctional P-loop containing nucleoside triphosphate hydrolase/CWF11 family/DNA2-NAM7 helicase-like n=1 Tax=Babesia duncani TaxID=323732 RepID=A0AAD9PMJ8_9APIC|nr:bifunctional P-loop containing nucleoside triphosphate hydrolase/CWF11 family/DNA2-NAM7 helicase-like [Babesia duncani]
MRIINRASPARSRFTCKKITYLENVRYRRNEITKAITERKRLERVLFLPQVCDEVAELTHESVQRILHQGSLFHIYKNVENIETQVLEKNVNLKRLDNQNLVLFFTRECNFNKQKRRLGQILNAITNRLDSLSLVHCSQIAFCITKLPNSLKNFTGRKLLLDIIERIDRLPIHKYVHYSSSLIKLAYAIAELSALDSGLLPRIISLFPSNISSYSDNIKRDINLLSKTLLQTGIANYEFLAYACGYYATKLQESSREIENFINERNSNPRIIFTLEHHDLQLLDLQSITNFTKCLEYFGYNNKRFYSLLYGYIKTIVAHPYLYKKMLHSTPPSTLYDIGVNYILHPSSFRDMLESCAPQIQSKEQQFIMKKLYDYYVHYTIDNGMDTSAFKACNSESNIYKRCPDILKSCLDYLSDPSNARFNTVHEHFLHLVNQLPHVIDWPCITKVFKVYSAEKAFEHLLLFRSYLEEAFIKPQEAVVILGHVLDNLMDLMDLQDQRFQDLGQALLTLDGGIRIVELCLESFDCADEVNLNALVYLVNYIVKSNDMCNHNDDFKQLLNRLHAMIWAHVTTGTFSKSIPRVEITQNVASMYLKAHVYPKQNLALHEVLLADNINDKIKALMDENAILELQESDFYKILLDSVNSDLPQLVNFKTPKDVINSSFEENICKIYELLISDDYSQFSLSALDHSNYTNHLWPLLSLELFPLIPDLDPKLQQRYARAKIATVMVSVWSLVQEHFSGKIDWHDSLESLIQDHPNGFECIFYNAAQLLMISTWSPQICDSRKFDDCDKITTIEQRALVRFFIICFRRFEIAGIRRCCVQLLSHASWLHISPQARELAIYANNKVASVIFARATKALEERVGNVYKEEKKLANVKNMLELYQCRGNQTNLNTIAKFVLNRDFMNSILNHFVYILEDCIDLEVVTNAEEGQRVAMMHRIMLCENYLEFVIDLLSQLNTRRVIKPLFDCKLIFVRCKHNDFYRHLEGSLFKCLVDILDFYLRFYINEELGTPLQYSTVLEQYYERFEAFQKLCFTKFKQDEIIGRMHLMSPFECNRDDTLENLLAKCKTKSLVDLAMELGLVPLDTPIDGLLQTPHPIILVPMKPKDKKKAKAFLISVLKEHLLRPVNMLDHLNNIPLYPTEELLWSTTQLPSEYICLSSMGLQKLNLQYLTLFDYLYRNFSLYRLESAYQIRMDLENVIYSVNPRGYITRDAAVAQARDPNTDLLTATKFEGYHHMALAIESMEIDNIQVSNVLQEKNSRVEAHVIVDTCGIKEFAIRKQWQNLRKHDVLFLVSIVAPLNNDERRLDLVESPEEIPLMFGINLVRGAQLIQVLDEEGQVISDMNPYESTRPMGFKLTMKLLLDYNQYKMDIEQDPNLYMSMNLLIRRDAKVNNFKAVLSTLKRMINAPTKLPEWLHEPFLGFGDARLAQYPRLEPELWTRNYLDTYKSIQHFMTSNIGFVLAMVKTDANQALDPNCKIESSRISCYTIKDFKGKSIEDLVEHVSKQFGLETVKIQKTGDAYLVKSQEYQCLVQVNYEMANKVLQGIFILKHQFRSDFSVNAQCILMEPSFVLDETSAAFDKTFEFTRNQIECIRSGTSNGLTLIVGPPGTGKTDVVAQIAAILFNSSTTERTIIVAHSNFALDDIFEKIVQSKKVHKEYMVRLGGSDHMVNGQDFSKWGRVNYLLQKRLDLLDIVKQLADSLGKEGDYNFNIQHALLLFESHVLKLADGGALNRFFESEINFAETCSQLGALYLECKYRKTHMVFIRDLYEQIKALQPFEVLRNNTDRGNFLIEKVARLVAMTSTHAAIAKDSLESLTFENLIVEEAGQILDVETFAVLSPKLSRIVLSGDHHQLGPIVQNQSCSKYSNLHQSLFHRLIRLQTPYIMLDKQGRSRPEIADLYLDVYGKNAVTSMEHTMQPPNHHFEHVFQFINVPDGEESCPIAHFYQNLQEAEFVVATFMYMRLVGYARESIVILCAYNGQRALVEDIVKAKCSWNPQIGAPMITTIDKFQGRQADFVLCSMVRTKRLGHLNDPRRCLVAFSRAKLGLYIFGNWDLFNSSRHLHAYSRKLAKFPQRLQIKSPNCNILEVATAAEMYKIVSLTPRRD